MAGEKFKMALESIATNDLEMFRCFSKKISNDQMADLVLKAIHTRLSTIDFNLELVKQGYTILLPCLKPTYFMPDFQFNIIQALVHYAYIPDDELPIEIYKSATHYSYYLKKYFEYPGCTENSDAAYNDELFVPYYLYSQMNEYFFEKYKKLKQEKLESKPQPRESQLRESKSSLSSGYTLLGKRKLGRAFTSGSDNLEQGHDQNRQFVPTFPQ